MPRWPPHVQPGDHANDLNLIPLDIGGDPVVCLVWRRTTAASGDGFGMNIATQEICHNLCQPFS